MSEFLFNNKSLKDRRRELRSKETEAESRLWSCLSNKQLNGLKFYRQYSIGGFVLDFYCPKMRLGIELDGGYHGKKEAKLYDKEREETLKISNIILIRFWNKEVMEDVESVLKKMIKKIDKLNISW